MKVIKFKSFEGKEEYISVNLNNIEIVGTNSKESLIVLGDHVIHCIDNEEMLRVFNLIVKEKDV